MTKTEFENAFGKQFEKFKDGADYLIYRKLSSSQKDLIKKKQAELKNWKNSGLEVLLYVESQQIKNRIHRMIAERFLKNEEGDVHHIDNNSYNNSVTNLIYIESKIHGDLAVGHKVLHPVSH